MIRLDCDFLEYHNYFCPLYSYDTFYIKVFSPLIFNVQV